MALITKKKFIYPISNRLRRYLVKYGRERQLPFRYRDLTRYNNTIPLYDKKGQDTLWETVFYPQSDMAEIYEGLKAIYADLKTDGDRSVIKHLHIDRVDICTFANTKPFRIRIINEVNDNFDYFYIKKADASRIYGLELEHVLSPNVINYCTHEETLVEEHIAGIPGDVFMAKHLNDPSLNQIRLAKEFVKFNERCFVRLLGDMHSANFVVIITPDFEDFHYRIRSIDFDQQSYEARAAVYQPRYFKQNNPLIELGMKHITPESMRQYQIEERSMVANRLRAEKVQMHDLLESMKRDEITTQENMKNLKSELAYYYRNKAFLACNNIGEVLEMSLNQVLSH